MGKNALIVFICSVWLGLSSCRMQPVAVPVRGLPRAHAHNDYMHERPLYDALSHGFGSIEADVFLGELEPKDVIVEAYCGRLSPSDQYTDRFTWVMEPIGAAEDRVYHYQCDIRFEEVRVEIGRNQADDLHVRRSDLATPIRQGKDRRRNDRAFTGGRKGTGSEKETRPSHPKAQNQNGKEGTPRSGHDSFHRSFLCYPSMISFGTFLRSENRHRFGNPSGTRR